MVTVTVVGHSHHCVVSVACENRCVGEAVRAGGGGGGRAGSKNPPEIVRVRWNNYLLLRSQTCIGIQIHGLCVVCDEARFFSVAAAPSSFGNAKQPNGIFYFTTIGGSPCPFDHGGSDRCSSPVGGVDSGGNSVYHRRASSFFGYSTFSWAFGPHSLDQPDKVNHMFRRFIVGRRE